MELDYFVIHKINQKKEISYDLAYVKYILKQIKLIRKLINNKLSPINDKFFALSPQNRSYQRNEGPVG